MIDDISKQEAESEAIKWLSSRGLIMDTESNNELHNLQIKRIKAKLIKNYWLYFESLGSERQLSKIEGLEEVASIFLTYEEIRQLNKNTEKRFLEYAGKISKNKDNRFYNMCVATGLNYYRKVPSSLELCKQMIEDGIEIFEVSEINNYKRYKDRYSYKELMLMALMKVKYHKIWNIDKWVNIGEVNKIVSGLFEET